MLALAMETLWSMGVKVPLKVWSDAAKWCLQTQQSDGGFAYHPGTSDGPAGANSYSNMTFAGTTCLFVARIYLYGDKPYYGQEARVKPKKFGVLDEARAQTAQEDWSKRRTEAGEVVSMASLDQGIGRGIAWVASHWSAVSPTGLP